MTNVTIRQEKVSSMSIIRLQSTVTLLLILFGVTTIGMALAEETSRPKSRVFVPAGGFDWHRTIGRRPIFTVDYWPGVPAITKEGRPDMLSDFEHFKAYADPVTVRTLRGGYAADAVAAADPERNGVYVMPDLIGLTDGELQDWSADLRDKLRSNLAQYRKAGLRVIDLHTFFFLSGSNSAPEWYRQIPDWAECNLAGQPIDSPCLTHPKLYEVVDRTFEAMSFLRDEPTFLGIHLENEPHMGRVSDLTDYGGNPHSRQAFRKFLQETFGSVDKLNQSGGTSFSSFDVINIADRNWLVRVMAARFRSTLVTGVYQTRLAQLAKKHFPQAVTMTRLATGPYLRDQNGKQEINGLEFTHLKDSLIDIISWSHHTRGLQNDFLGQLNVTGGILRGVGKPIGFTEPHVSRFTRRQWGVYRPAELQHLIYRGLFYNFRMFNLHSWDRGGDWAIYNEPFGAVHSKRPGLMRMVATLRFELERSAPFETFGSPVMPPLRLLISRSARHYPGMAGSCYGIWLNNLCRIMNVPQFTAYEILEEQTCDVAEELKNCRGLVVSDACLSEETRQQLSDFVLRGGHLLILGAPATVGSNYEPAKLPEAYPVSASRMSLAKLTEEDIPASVDCKAENEHPVLSGLSSVKLLRPAGLELRSSAKVVARSPLGDPVGAATERVVYLAGFPTDASQQRALLDNFGRWCGIDPPELLVSQFEHATVVQKWDINNQHPDGSVINTKPFTGSIPMSGSHDGTIQELRDDHPWLAYHRDTEGRIVLEGVRVDPKGVKVFRKEAARELAHFEDIPDTVGFEYFWAGQLHPIIARFTVTEATDVDAQLVGGPWDEDQIGWYVVEIGKERVAGGKGRQIRFHAEPGKHYYLTASLPEHFELEYCPLCQNHAFE
jgi:hypothetical protein